MNVRFFSVKYNLKPYFRIDIISSAILQSVQNLPCPTFVDEYVLDLQFTLPTNIICHKYLVFNRIPTVEHSFVDIYYNRMDPRHIFTK